MMIELKCLTCIHGELCSYKHGGVDLAIISGDCKSYKSTADVVPKSEAENYKKIAEHQQSVSMRRYFEIKQLKEELAKTKQEVAREIFEEMQSCLIQRHWNGLNIVSFEFDAVKYANLKKKYTKESE